MHRAPPRDRGHRGCPAGLVVAGALLVLATAGLLAAIFLIYRP